MKVLIKHILFVFIFTVSITSCVDFLDQTPDAIAYSDEEVFTDYTKSLQFINQVMIPYLYFDDNDVTNYKVSVYYNTTGNYPITHGKLIYGLRERITDNCIANQQYSWVAINRYRSGDFYPEYRDKYWCEGSYLRWETIWKAIRITNLSIKNVDRIANVTSEQKDKILGMAYFLRAHFYFMLLQGWGGMPYITEPMDPAQNMDLPRDSYVLTAQKIAKDFDSAAVHLPLIVPDAEWGRPSKMGAIAYKAKTLVWAASPFANTDNSQQLWADAAIACGQAIQIAESSGYYQLVSLDNFKKLFVDCNAETLKEVLFGRLFNNVSFGNFSPYYCGIKSVAFGSGTMGAESVTENLAQCYSWSNGEPIDPSTDEYKHTPYTGDGIHHTGRDPRFYQTILYNGAVAPQVSALGRTVQIWNKSYNNATALELLSTNGVAQNGYTFTGYYNWKLFSDAFATKGKTNLMWNYVRLADIYLYYAEAANRAWGANTTPPQDKLPGFSMTAINAINKVRERAGMPAYDIASPNAWLNVGSVEEFEQKIRNEIRIETAFEEKRFYDLRRWKLMLDPTIQTMYGMYIEQTAQGKFTYTVTPIPTNLNLQWQERHYLFKIKPSDTYLGTNFIQNPGW